LGECSAGLFDLIGVDRKLIEEHRRLLTRDIPAPARADALYRIALSSARMLLVTRGIEAPTDTAVFLSFEQHFISAGLVDEAHRPIVVAARVRDLPALLNNQGAVLALATSVRELYDNMDHTLRFPAEIARSAASA
jgi:sulfite reductase (ferredoxin)